MCREGATDAGPHRRRNGVEVRPRQEEAPAVPSRGAGGERPRGALANWRARRPSGERTASGVQGVQRSVERPLASTNEMNEKLKERESRRVDAKWQSRDQLDSHEWGLECAKEMANARLDHPHEPDLEWHYGPGCFVDDVRGGFLDKGMCIEAGRLEMQFFRKMGVYRKLRRADLPPGAKVITTKWVDTNKVPMRCPITA